VVAVLPVTGSKFVLAGVTGDGEQPGSGVGVAPVTREGAYRFEDDFLGEVTGALSVDQGGAEVPHLLIGGLDELVEGLRVATSGRVGEPVEGIHRH
jgi:hypothetical protein